MDFSLSLVILVINALALALVAIWNYRNLGTLVLMKNFNSYFLSYMVTLLLVLLLGSVLGAGWFSSSDLSINSPKFLANWLGFFLCFPAFLPLVIIIAFGYAFTKIPGNEGRLSYALFALLLLQQIWYAIDSPDPIKSMQWLGMLYFVGYFIVLFATPNAASMLARAFPDTERRHNEWVKKALSDPNFGAGDKAAKMIIMNIRASTPSKTVPGPNETHFIYNTCNRPVFNWTADNAAAALVIFSIWNLIMYVLPIMI